MSAYLIEYILRGQVYITAQTVLVKTRGLVHAIVSGPTTDTRCDESKSFSYISSD